MIKKKLLGLLGENVHHSFSPSIFNFFFYKFDLDYLYIPFSIPAKKFSQFIRNLNKSQILGLNVTIPYKEKVIPYLTSMDDSASTIGAVNVIKNKKGELKGFNTDFIGFKRALEKYMDFHLESAVILGAGGAGRSVIYSLYKLKFKKIIFFSRDKNKIKKILKDFSFISNLKGQIWDEEKIKEECKEADILINATPLGMIPYEEYTPVNIDFPLSKNFIAFDLIYNPGITKFLRIARERGAIIENGVDMLIYQALESIKIWLGNGINEYQFIKTGKEVINATVSNSG